MGDRSGHDDVRTGHDVRICVGCRQLKAWKKWVEGRPETGWSGAPAAQVARDMRTPVEES